MAFNQLSLADLVLVHKALHAYMEHLTPSAMHFKEVHELRSKIDEVRNKISDILLAGES